MTAMTRFAIPMIALVMTWIPSARGQTVVEDPPTSARDEVTLHFVQPRSLSRILDHLGETTGCKIVYDWKNLAGIEITLDLPRTHWRDVLDWIAGRHQLLLVDLPGHGVAVINTNPRDPAEDSETMRFVRMVGIRDLDTFKVFSKIYKDSGCSRGYLEEILEIKGPNGKPQFDAFDVLHLWGSGCGVLYVRSLLRILDRDGRPLFEVHDLVRFHGAGGESRYANDLAAIRDDAGNLIFSAQDMIDLAGFCVPLDYVAEMTLENASAQAIRYYHDLGLKPSDYLSFEDTRLPNALVVLPSSDWNGAFHLKDFYDIILEIRSRHDTLILCASREQDVYHWMKTLPSIDLLYLCGHGNRRELRFGKGQEEACILDPSDEEMALAAGNLRHGGTCILHSCSTGQGGALVANLATMIHRFLGGRVTLIASKTVLYAHDFQWDRESSCVRSEANTVRLPAIPARGENRTEGE